MRTILRLLLTGNFGATMASLGDRAEEAAQAEGRYILAILSEVLRSSLFALMCAVLIGALVISLVVGLWLSAVILLAGHYSVWGGPWDIVLVFSCSLIVLLFVIFIIGRCMLKRMQRDINDYISHWQDDHHGKSEL